MSKMVAWLQPMAREYGALALFMPGAVVAKAEITHS